MMTAESGRVQSQASSERSPFSELAKSGSLGGGNASTSGGGSGSVQYTGRPPRPPSLAEEGYGSGEALDSPVSGLVDTPSATACGPGAAAQMQSQPSGILKEEGSVRGGMRRAVSWADFSHEDPARLTEVKEFERDHPSSPTSVDSWDGEGDGVHCSCCSVQ